MKGIHGIVHGDVLEQLRLLPSNEFDALLCDPPYGFSFMGKAWDYDVPSVEVWREALRVLKPGAPLVAFGGARTYHRIATGIEDAGFHLRDCLMWLYGKGFPKSQNIGLAIDKAAGATREVVAQGHRKATGRLAQGEGGYAFGEDYAITAPATDLAQQWQGYGTALKPAWEPIVLARKPLIGTMAENVAAFGVGGLAIDECRIGDSDLGAGRWPANLILDEHAGAELDASVAPTTSVPYRENEATGAVLPMKKRAAGGYADSGGPSRFFYCAKVSTKERELGCEALPMKSAGEMTEREDGQVGLENPRAGAGRTGGARNHHPTLKPIALTRWLASLIKPPTEGAQLLIPYSGAGSEIVGALQAGWPLVFGIEGDADYIRIAEARIAAWRGR